MYTYIILKCNLVVSEFVSLSQTYLSSIHSFILFVKDVIKLHQNKTSQAPILRVTEFAYDTGAEKELKLAKMRVFDHVRVFIEVVRTVLLAVVAGSACVRQKSCKTVVA